MTLINPNDPPRPPSDGSGALLFLNLIGVGCVALGLYYLVWAPLTVANLYETADAVTSRYLVTGQTAIVSGVIFLAAAWRPR